MNDISPDQAKAAQELTEIVKRKSKKRKTATGPKKQTIQDQFEQAAAIAKDETRWEEMRDPKMIVGLYGWLHLQVYGVDAAPELSGKAGLGARSSAKRFLEKDFNGDVKAMMHFFRWCWSREQEREKKRRESGFQGARITYHLQFGPRLLVDYRLMMRRFEPMPSATRVADPVLDKTYAIEAVA